MKFAYLLVLAAVRAEEEGEEGADANACTSNADCPPTEDAEGAEVARMCATMSNEEAGISQDLCVKDILCGETVEYEGNLMKYDCMGEEEESSTYIKACAFGAIAYAMYSI